MPKTMVFCNLPREGGGTPPDDAICCTPKQQDKTCPPRKSVSNSNMTGLSTPVMTLYYLHTPILILMYDLSPNACSPLCIPDASYEIMSLTIVHFLQVLLCTNAASAYYALQKHRTLITVGVPVAAAVLALIIGALAFKFYSYMRYPPPPDQVLGDILTDSVALGAGASGVVRRGKFNNENVAIKVFSKEKKSDFDLELEIFQRLPRHMNIIR